MPLPEEIVQELRVLFRKGATPSRLLRHIISRFPGEVVSPWTLRDYLEKAFGVPMARLIQPGMVGSADQTRLAVLNRTLIPEILERRAAWDEAGSSLPTGGCWFDGLAATDPEEVKASTNGKPHPSLSE